MKRPEALDIVDEMDLEEGHKLTKEECEAIEILLRESIKLGQVRIALGING